MANFFVVATPIGNLKDISQRAIETLKEVDFVLAEDTRTTKNLLSFFGIKKEIISYHQHSKIQKIEEIKELMKQGKNLALVCDAGTPGISDPGNKLISEIINVFGEEVKIIPIPGPTALTAAASVSGFPMDRFLFLGFPPTKRKRKKFFQEVVNSKFPVIFYESPHRIIKTLEELNLATKEFNNTTTKAVVCRELTKKFETIYRGEIDEVLEKIKKDEVRGEFVVITWTKR